MQARSASAASMRTATAASRSPASSAHPIQRFPDRSCNGPKAVASPPALRVMETSPDSSTSTR